MFDEWLSNLRKQGDVEILDPALETPAPETPPQAAPSSAPASAPASEPAPTPALSPTSNEKGSQ
jgi:hypothetical protein